MTMIQFHEVHETVFDQFRRARRRADVERILAWLRKRSADLLCYEQVRDRRLPRGTRELGIQEIPVESIVGSVGRCSDYTREFMPLKDSDRLRWTRVMEAATSALELPPISAYRVGEIYYVADGHHRVSVARERGQDFIAAMVVEIQI
jgi:uncharacterized ParB-like nuclease family protein